MHEGAVIMSKLFIPLFLAIVSISILPDAQADARTRGAISGGLKALGEIADDRAQMYRQQLIQQQAEEAYYRALEAAERQNEARRVEAEKQRLESERQNEARRVAAEEQRRQAESQRQEAEKQKAEQDRQDKEAKAVYTGSGFFVTQDGYFVTNHHIVKKAKSILLVTTDGKRLEARVVRSDVANDLVLLKVDGKYSALPVTSSRIVKRGQSVATIGYPHTDIQGVEPKVTEGIVSSLSGISDDPRMFQISVPIQSGNSGGPLFTKEGNVIGVVVSKLSVAVMLQETGDVTQNVNYAVKSNYLIELLKDSGLEQKLLPANKISKNLEAITVIVEKATALVIASPTQTIVAVEPPPMPRINPTPNATPTTVGKGFRDCSDCPEMVVIPGTKYALGKYEVTQAEWQAMMGYNPSVFIGDNLPVERVSWSDVQKYLTKLNQKTGKQYRLPNEAEWEYACNGGSQTEYCGSNDINAVAWHDKNSDDKTHPAGQKQANGYGLYDMSGNVWEWMDDCRKGDCAQRALRGGAWSSDSQRARYAIHIRVDSEFYRYNNSGFRLARTLP